MIGFTRVSNNSKTGPIPVSTAGMSTCPSSCPLKKNGCYADSGPLALFWRRISDGSAGYDWKTFLKLIRDLPEGTLWRHAQAGDLPGVGDRLDAVELKELAEANRRRKGYAYTHKPLRTPAERRAVRSAVLAGFAINLSANSPAEVDSLLSLKIAPAVCLVPLGSPEESVTPGGVRVSVCRHQVSGIRCVDCRICADSGRDFAVGFVPHGASKARANLVALGGVRGCCREVDGKSESARDFSSAIAV